MEALLGVVSLMFLGFNLGYAACAIWAKWRVIQANRQVEQLKKEVQDIEEKYGRLIESLRPYSDGINQEETSPDSWPGISIKFDKIV